MGQTIACTNQKGGVGKTTTVVNLATYLALLGDRVLVIDLDPQGNATSGFGIDRDSIDGSVYDALVDGRPLARAAPRDPRRGPSPHPLVDRARRRRGRARRRSTAASGDSAGRSTPERDAWDWILVDCPPSLGLLTVNALTGADAVLVPIQCEYYALEGLTQLIATINLVRDHLNPDLAIAGVLLTMFDAAPTSRPRSPPRCAGTCTRPSSTRSSRAACASRRRRATACRSRSTGPSRRAPRRIGSWPARCGHEAVRGTARAAGGSDPGDRTMSDPSTGMLAGIGA